MARSIVVAWMFLFVGGCGLNEDRACDLAVEWLDAHGFPTSSGKKDDWELQRCTNFRSQREEKGALIDVVGKTTITVFVTGGGQKEQIEKEVTPTATCALIDWDQGWQVEACTVK